MKVSIELHSAENTSGLFSSTDWIKGDVLLSLQRADAISRVTLTLQGR